MKRKLFAFCATLLLVSQCGIVLGQSSNNTNSAVPLSKSFEDWADRLTAEFVGEVRLRSLGPTLKPGRVADITVDPRNRSVWYLANASSGL